MTIELTPLPFAGDALEPYMTAETLRFHHGEHHRAYADKTRKLIEGTELADQPIEQIILHAWGEEEDRALFNNAAQFWNHAFFWNSLSPPPCDEPHDLLTKQIEKSFGSVDGLKESFLEAALGRFGSGWAWLVAEDDELSIETTPNAEPPFVHGKTPILTCDLWEHAYYLDFQNRRGEYVRTFLDHLVNWEFASLRFRQTLRAVEGYEARLAV